MRPWWDRLPARLIAEDEAINAARVSHPKIVKGHRWTKEASGDLALSVSIAVGTATHELQVRFPPHYPDGCPSVRPVPYEKPISSHQFKTTGVFCLEIGPDNWHPRYKAADMVMSAWRLIAQEWIAEFKEIEIPSRHSTDLAERVALGDGVLLRSSALEAALAAAQGSVEFQFAWMTRGKVRIVPVAFPKGVRLADIPPAFTEETAFDATFVQLDDGAPVDVPQGDEQFREFVSRHGHVALQEAPFATPMLLRWADGTTRGFFRTKTGVKRLVDMAIDASPGARMPGDLGARLMAAKVAIVGAGSLGSKVAVSLARSGVRRFVVVDGDVLEGPNLCRHQAGFSYVGTPKAACVGELIRDVSAAEPEVSVHFINVAAPTNPVYHASMLEELAGADVIIDATANPEAFLPLAMVASNARRPLVWGEVFGGGLGGMVASAHPEHGPCPRCVRAGFLDGARQWPPAPGREGGAPYEGSDSEPVPAIDADVEHIASALTARVVDLIAGRGRPPAVALIGLRAGWIFDGPQVVPVHVREDDWSCDRCWSPEEEADPLATALADKLFSSANDDQDTASH